MKIKNISKIFSFILVIALTITFIPQGTLKIFAEDSLVEETTELETETEEDSEEDWIIDDSFLEEIVPPGSDVSINNWLDDPSLYEPIGGGLSYLPNGVYAINNFGNSGFCAGILNDSTDAGGTVVQVSATNVTSDFDRSCLFKITRVGETTRYIIRSMLNNRLILSYNGSKFVTKEVSPNDANVNINDTFIILGSSSGGYTITPYGGTQVIAAPNSTASDTAGAALVKTSSSSAGNRGKWSFTKYVGASKSGISLPISPTNWNYGAKVGTTYTIKLKTWSTEIGANTPYLTVHPDYTDMATYSWNSSTYTLTITPTKEGPIGIRSIIRRDGTTTAFRTYKSVYSVVPDLNGDTAFIQNVGTSKYIDLESASMVEGGIIQQWSFHTGTQAQWIFEVAYGGLFYIKSVRSGMYVGVDPNNTASVKQYATKNSYTQWRLKKTSSGNFAFYCYALESSGLVLSTPLSTNANGDNLTMLAYTNDSNYRDEWKIEGKILNSVPTSLRSNDNHLCIPCAITNIAGYWSKNGYSQFGCSTSTQQENVAKAVQAKMIQDSGSSTGHKANNNMQYGFNYFSHTENNKTYILSSQAIWQNNSNFSIETIISELNANRPVMIGFASGNGSPYSNHMTVCTGYDFVGNDFYVYVSDAHTSTYQKHLFNGNTYNDFIGIVKCVISAN